MGPWGTCSLHMSRIASQARLVAGVIAHRRRHVAGQASWRASCPRRRERQAEGEQGLRVARDVSHADTHLAGVDLPSVVTPWALHPDRMRPPRGDAAGIASHDALGFAQPLGRLPTHTVAKGRCSHSLKNVLIGHDALVQMIHENVVSTNPYWRYAKP
jgi:hypothetical protein